VLLSRATPSNCSKVWRGSGGQLMNSTMAGSQQCECIIWSVEDHPLWPDQRNWGSFAGPSNRKIDSSILWPNSRWRGTASQTAEGTISWPGQLPRSPCNGLQCYLLYGLAM